MQLLLLNQSNLETEILLIAMGLFISNLKTFFYEATLYNYKTSLLHTGHKIYF
jgi:hypothetical protein